MEEKLKEFLKPDEHILWSGQSAAFPLLDKRAGTAKRILTRWIVEVILAAALLTAYIANNNPPSPVFLLVVTAITVFLILSPVLEQKSVMGARYWITDQRVILMQKNRSIFSMGLEYIDAFRIVRDEAPYPCLVMGSRIFGDINKQLRWRSSHPLDQPSSTDDNNSVGLVFYNVKNLDQAEALLKQYSTAA